MKDTLSYLAFGALVMGGVPLRDLPEIAEAEGVLPQKKRKPHSRNLMSWLRSLVPLLEMHHRPVAAH